MCCVLVFAGCVPPCPSQPRGWLVGVSHKSPSGAGVGVGDVALALERWERVWVLKLLPIVVHFLGCLLTLGHFLVGLIFCHCESSCVGCRLRSASGQFSLGAG